MKKFLLILFILSLIIAACFGGKVWFDKNSKVKKAEIDIFEGASVAQVTELLEISGAIENSSILYFYIKGKEFYYDINPWTDKTFDVSFKAGKFNIESGDFDSLVAYLNESNNIESENDGLTTIPEGFTIKQIAETLEENDIVSEKSFLKMMNDDEFYDLMKKEYKWLPDIDTDVKYYFEGYLYPDTYDFSEDIPQSIVKKMLEGTNEWYKNNKLDIHNSSFSFDEIVTLASIVEKESKFEDDRPKVSQVFLNRINEGMKLQSDITAAYANGDHKVFMTYDDISVDSPFNTYEIDGLPPGPINSPSLESLNSVIEPEGEDFNDLFFYARPDGETFYSETLDEHQDIIDKYEQEWLDLEE